MIAAAKQLPNLEQGEQSWKMIALGADPDVETGDEVFDRRPDFSSLTGNVFMTQSSIRGFSYCMTFCLGSDCRHPKLEAHGSKAAFLHWLLLVLRAIMTDSDVEAI